MQLLDDTRRGTRVGLGRAFEPALDAFLDGVREPCQATVDTLLDTPFDRCSDRLLEAAFRAVRLHILAEDAHGVVGVFAGQLLLRSAVGDHVAHQAEITAKKFDDDARAVLLELGVVWNLHESLDHLRSSCHADVLTIAAPTARILVHAVVRMNQVLLNLVAFRHLTFLQEANVNLPCVIVIAALGHRNDVVDGDAWRVLGRLAGLLP